MSLSISANRARAAAAGVAAVLASACSLAPKYVKPDVDAPSAYKEVSAADGTVWKIAEPRDAMARSESDQVVLG